MNLANRLVACLEKWLWLDFAFLSSSIPGSTLVSRWCECCQNFPEILKNSISWYQAPGNMIRAGRNLYSVCRNRKTCKVSYSKRSSRSWGINTNSCLVGTSPLLVTELWFSREILFSSVGRTSVMCYKCLKGIIVGRIFISSSAATVHLLLSCPTLCDPLDCSPPGSFVHGILQARTLEWVAISFSRGSSPPRDWTPISCLAGRFFTTEPPGKPSFHLRESKKKSAKAWSLGTRAAGK